MSIKVHEFWSCIISFWNVCEKSEQSIWNKQQETSFRICARFNLKNWFTDNFLKFWICRKENTLTDYPQVIRGFIRSLCTYNEKWWRTNRSWWLWEHLLSFTWNKPIHQHNLHQYHWERSNILVQHSHFKSFHLSSRICHCNTCQLIHCRKINLTSDSSYRHKQLQSEHKSQQEFNLFSGQEATSFFTADSLMWISSSHATSLLW